MRILLSLIFSLLLISNAYAESGWSGDVASDIRNDTLYFDNNLSSLDDTVQKALETLDELTAGGSMVYPSAGIPLSTGSAWGTSITDNSSNWNTAYSWGQGLKLDQTTPQTVINGVPSITNGLLIGSDANLTDFPLAKFISSAGNTGHTYTGNIGTIGEAVAGVADTGTGVGGVAKTNGANQGRGVAGVGKVSATGDGGASIGGYFRAEDTHAGGRNIGCYAFATGGLYNNALYLAGGDIYTPQSQSWTLYDNYANALRFNSTGKNDILNIDTTDSAEKVTMSGGLTVTGNINNTALTASKVVFTDASKNLTSTGIGTSSQFIKGDGSLDSSTYLTSEVDGSVTNELPIAGNLIDISGTPASTVDVDLTEAGDLTWGSGSASTMVHTYNLSGTDVTVTFGSNSVTFSGDLHVLGDLYVTDVFVSSADSGIISTNNVDTASAQTGIFQGDRATPTDNDTGYISFKLSDDGGTQSEFSRMSWVAPDVSAGSLDGLLKFGVVTNGSLADFMTLGAGALALGTNDLTMTGSLGATGARLTKGWFTDLEVTNAIAGSVTGNAGTVTNGVYTTSFNKGTFVNADLSTGVLTITHNKSLSAPYQVLVKIFNNSSKEIEPDDITGSANSTAIDLSSYGTLTGTWGYILYTQ